MRTDLEGVLDHAFHLAAGGFSRVGDEPRQVHQIQWGVVLRQMLRVSQTFRCIAAWQASFGPMTTASSSISANHCILEMSQSVTAEE